MNLNIIYYLTVVKNASTPFKLITTPNRAFIFFHSFFSLRPRVISVPTIKCIKRYFALCRKLRGRVVWPVNGSKPVPHAVKATGSNNSNRDARFGKKSKVLNESGDFAGSQDTLEFFREMGHALQNKSKG